MAERMHRTQVLLPEREYLRLQRLARERRRSLGSLVREAVGQYQPEVTREERMAAAQTLIDANLDIPVQSWEEIEEDMLRSRYRECPDLGDPGE
jgi:hypothetical protein